MAASETRRKTPAGRLLPLALLAAASLFGPAAAQEAPGTEGRGGKVHEAIRRAIPRVVKIFGASRIRGIPGHASGTIVSAEGHILTQDSIMLSADKLSVVLSDGRELKADLIRKDAERSVALIKVEAGEPLPYFPPEDPGPLRVGQWVLSVANPFRIARGEEWPSVNLGVVSAITRLDLRLGLHDFPYRGEVIVTDATNNQGGFGGALVDLKGRLVGINGRTVESKETNTQISYAVPIGDLIPLIDGSILLREDEGETEVPVRHGIRLFDIGTRRSPPAYVDRVEADSPAARAGLRKGDLIFRCHQTPVRSCKEFRELIGRFRPGEEVSITFKRGEEILGAVIRLEAAEGAEAPGEEGR